MGKLRKSTRRGWETPQWLHMLVAQVWRPEFKCPEPPKNKIRYSHGPTWNPGTKKQRQLGSRSSLSKTVSFQLIEWGLGERPCLVEIRQRGKETLSFLLSLSHTYTHTHTPLSNLYFKVLFLCVGCSAFGKPEEGVGSFGAGVIGGWEPHGCWEPNSGPPED